MAGEVVYWEPAANTEQASSTSIPEEEEQAIYYQPPQTPQEAIERGIVDWKAEKPKSFVPHWKRLGPSHKPKYWHCWWQCEGVVSVLDNPIVATHDYYCPYWEMILLFPELETFQDDLFNRPPKPPNGDPYIEKEFYERQQQHREAVARVNEGIKTNPHNIETEQTELRYSGTRITKERSAENSGHNTSTGQWTVPKKRNTKPRKESTNSEWEFSEAKPKSQRAGKSSKRDQ